MEMAAHLYLKKVIRWGKVVMVVLDKNDYVYEDRVTGE